MSIHTYLEQQFELGFFSALDISFARFIADVEHEIYADRMMFISALVSRELGQGHVCIDINALQGLHLEDTPPQMAEFIRDPKAFLAELNGAKTLTILEDKATSNTETSQATPLVYDLGSIYLYRYWHDECLLSARLQQMCTESLPVDTKAQQALELLFPQTASKESKENKEIDWQKTAAAVALSRQFALISGGPGTGKTTTVAKLLATLIAQDASLKISLAAPTGKAAARLSKSIGKAVQQLDISPEIKALLPAQAQTLHRLLGARANSKRFGFNAENRLHLDVLILDEASMVDLPLMTRLIEALPERARLILLGDRDQLASVEAGAILGDICQDIESGYTHNQAMRLGELTGFDLSPYANAQTGINDSLCLLRHSYRFDAQSGIGQLAKAINAGSVGALDKIWQGGFNDIDYHALDTDAYRALIKQSVEAYTPYLEAIYNRESPDKVLRLFSEAQILCAVREGELGVEGINHAVKSALAKQELLAHGENTWYQGRPVMVMRNDTHLGLFNGDIGICMLDSNSGQLKVYFIMPDAEVKSFLPSRLPEHEDVYAMTVHKSQGSEFAHTIMLLPKKHSPVITRELIYTGVTRAKQRFSLYAPKAVLNQGVKQRTHRVSGLGARLS